jgi:ferrous iron transport protein B
VASFAAREVFVGTLATIYSVGSDSGNEETIKSQMKSEINQLTGGPRYTIASGMSLLLFYAFAMQCMSTLAVTQRETNSWKWPVAQLVFMTGFAYAIAMISYQILS